MTVSPSSVTGGSNTSAFVSLSGARSGRWRDRDVVEQQPGVVGVPASVTVAEGTTARGFTVTTTSVTTTTTATITATLPRRLGHRDRNRHPGRATTASERRRSP